MMTVLRLLSDKDKAAALTVATQAVRHGDVDARVFGVEPKAFRDVPSAPFAYWVSDNVRNAFQRLPAFESEGRTAKQGLATADDFRFVRAWWEVGNQVPASDRRWFPFAKGGARSPFYADLCLVVMWAEDGAEVKAGICQRYPYLNGNPNFVAKNTDYYFRPGLTWPLRGITFSSQAVPRHCVFSVAGKMAFAPSEELLRWQALFNSKPFDCLIRLFAGKVGGVQYEAGLIGGTPVPDCSGESEESLSNLAHHGWSLKRTLDTVTETSHAFLLPSFLYPRLGEYNPCAIEAELANIQNEIDDIAFDLYGFNEADRSAMMQTSVVADGVEDASADDEATTADQVDGDDSVVAADAHAHASLLSWCVGVSFGRFDWRLATGEHKAPPEPDPFDPLPAKSPGMLPDGAEPFHTYADILVDDKGDPHDLPHLIEEVLEKVSMPIPSDVRNWLQHDFFASHLQHYSKSQRKAAIYWPLSARSGGYTLWVYYPSMTDQTLYTAVNDFVEPKLKQVVAQVTTLSVGGPKRTHDEEKRLEELENMEDDLTDLRDMLLKIAPTYHPNEDDGVQITAAPLWPLFHHKPWQKLLKETWTKLEKGDYDWAHLAMDYWPERVRAKCTIDKSLAIAHGLEDLYVEPETQERGTRTRRQ